MKIGIVDVGGGLRGVYAAGIFDYCLDTGIQFDMCIGVSAGSANITSYMAGQRGRNYPFYTEYSFRKEYMSFHNFLSKKSLIDLDYVYGVLSNSDGENPLDYDAFCKNPAQMYIVATDARTGEAIYFDKSSMARDCYDVMKASSSIPAVCRPYEIDGVPYYGGALSDPVPVEKAFRCGCDKVVLILTKPRDTIRTPKKDQKLAHFIQKKYPKAAEAFCLRAEKYNRSVQKAKEYEAEGRVLIVAPDDTCKVDTLTRDRQNLQRFYQKGLRDAQAITGFFYRQSYN